MRAFPYHASRQELRFPPPLAEHALEPARLDYAWRLLQFCFAFMDPSSAWPLDERLSEADAAVVTRFVQKARSLAGSPFLAHSTSLSVRPDAAGRETVTVCFLTRKASAGS